MTSGPRAPIATALLCVVFGAGCQLVFGIDDYRTDAGGEGSSGGSGAGGDDGDGGSGGEAACACDLDPIWRPVMLADRGPGDAEPPTQCTTGSTPTTLFAGVPDVACAPCGCDATGCQEPPLECFSGTLCTGTKTLPALGPSCVSSFTSCRSIHAAGVTSAAECSADGGEPLNGAPSFDEYLSFCGELGCSTGCRTAETACLMADGIPAGDCPAGFDQRYVLGQGGSPSCEACSCEASCTGATFLAGITGCDLWSVDDDECFSDTVSPVFSLQTNKTPTCTASPDGEHAGTFEVSGEHTLCCRAPLDGVPPR